MHLREVDQVGHVKCDIILAPPGYTRPGAIVNIGSGINNIWSASADTALDDFALGMCICVRASLRLTMLKGT